MHTYDRDGTYMVKATITIDNCVIDLYKEIQVYSRPNPLDNRILKQCVLDPSIKAKFNLNEIESILNLRDKEYQLSFYQTLEDASNNTNKIESPNYYQNTSEGEELYVKVITPEGCFDIANFFLETVLIDVQNIEPLFGCENSDGLNENNESLFDLSSKIESMKTELSLQESVIIGFYETYENAQLEKEPLPIEYISGPKTIWTRIENSQNECSGLGSFDLVIGNSINLEIQDTYTLCFDPIESSVSIDEGIGNERWEWKNDNDSIISIGRVFTTNSKGKYSVTVYKTQNGFECSRSAEFEIVDVKTSSIKTIETGNGLIKIDLNTSGDYQYSIDGRNYFGSGTSHTFENVRGIHSIYIQDIEQCEEPLSTNISIISFPKFFTPNNDGYNDRWKIYGISREFYLSANTKIYNRFGKLLHTMSLKDNEIGWEGHFKGDMLPTSDYWFETKLIDIKGETRTETGYFTLKN